MKRALKGLIVFLAAALAVGYTVRLATVATGTVTGSTASALSFATPMAGCVVLNNRNAGAAAAYFKLNDNATTPTVSATSYDVALDQNETLVIGRAELQYFPVSTVGVYSTQTTPTIRVVGW